MTVAEARNVLFEQECDALINTEKVNAKAVELAENLGIIFIDELDKIVASEQTHGDSLCAGRATGFAAHSRGHDRADAVWIRLARIIFCSSRPGRFNAPSPAT